MSTLQVAFNKTTRVALVQFKGGAVPSGSVKIGEFEHPDPVYPESYVLFQGVQHLLELTDAKDPTKSALFPNNITDMSTIKISFAYPAVVRLTTNLDTIKKGTVGNDVSFPLVVADGTSPYTYEWFYKQNIDHVWIKIDSAVNPTAATATLKNSAVTPDSAGEYKAIVTDAMGVKVESYVSVLTVDSAAPLPPLDSIKATPTSLSLSVAADAANGKSVTLSALPVSALLGTLSIKTPPAAAQATATLSGTTLTVKPVAAGASTTVVITNGTKDVSITVTVAA